MQLIRDGSLGPTYIYAEKKRKIREYFVVFEKLTSAFLFQIAHSSLHLLVII